jgi:hypothetical protein
MGRRAAVIALVAASGATGLGAAFLPDGPLCASAFAAPTTMELRMVPVELTPPPAADADRPWGQTLAFRCYDVGDGITCCIVSPSDAR